MNMGKTTLLEGWLYDHPSREEQKRLLLLSFAAVFCFGLAAHAYGFLRAGFSHDMLNALVVEPVETYWKMQLGRPGIVLYRRTVRGLVAAPWMLGILSLFWLSLACFLIGKLFPFRSPWFTVLAGGILAVNLSTTAMTATFLYEMDADCFALLLGVAAVLLWDRYRLPGALAGALCVAACISIYQSMVSLPITLIMLLSISALLRSRKFRPVFRNGLRALTMLALGGLLYWLGVKLMCSLKGINLAMGSYNDVGQTAALSLTGRILHTYRTWAWAFWNPAESHIEPFVLILNILLPLLALVPLLQWFCKKEAGNAEKLLLAALVLLLPLGMNTAQLAFRMDVHDLMKAAFWLFWLFCLLPFFTASEAEAAASVSEVPGSSPAAPAHPGGAAPASGLRPLRILATVLAFLLLGANIQTPNVVYTRKHLEQNATLSLMTRVLAMMDRDPDYRTGETALVFAGISPELQEKMPGFESTYDITGCEESSPIEKSLASYNYNTYAAYFRYILNSPALIPDAQTWNRLQADPRVKAMPCFPEEGCMQLIDGIFVVKMGNGTGSTGGAA